nr:hypothetical protein [Paraburkholderia sp. BL8N3]
MAEKNRVVPTFEITLPSFPMLSRMIVPSCVPDDGGRSDAARRHRKIAPFDRIVRDSTRTPETVVLFRNFAVELLAVNSKLLLVNKNEVNAT